MIDWRWSDQQRWDRVFLALLVLFVALFSCFTYMMQVEAQSIPETGGGPVGAADLSSCRVASSVDATFDDQPLPASMGQTVMITGAFCRCRGACSTMPVIQLHYEEADTGGPTDNVIGSMTCQATTDEPVVTGMTATVPALDELLIDVTNAPAGADTVTICIVYSTS